uniref:Glycosyltransferase n=1 Tax=Setaria italica TaxID=4555 RepID=K3ZZA3_SETIT
MDAMTSPSPTVVLLPMWASGHFSSMLQAGKRLLLCGASGAAAFSLTVLVIPPPTVSPSDASSRGHCEMVSGGGIDFHHLPAVEHRADLPRHPSGVHPALRAPPYVYFPSNGATLALMLRLPGNPREGGPPRSGMRAGVSTAGMPLGAGGSMPSPELNDYAWSCTTAPLHGSQRYRRNTAAELEPGVLAAIAAGPSPHECVRWLDAQAPASIVFLCFGSRGWMDARQAREVAAGLERSGRSFLWVLRGPPAGSSSMYPTDADLGDLLPDGFLERTKGKGLVWPSWAPQTEILAHAAVGGFVTHCGWNSILESLWHGVPMAPWPLYAEQPLNAFELVACMGVAVELGVGTGKDGSFVEAAEVERAVKELVGGGEEGRKAREKAMETKAACRNAVEKGGTSYAATQRVVQDMIESYAPK